MSSTLSEVDKKFSTEYARRPELNSTQMLLFAQLSSEYAGGADIVKAHVLVNAEATDPYRFPKGQVIAHPLDAKVKPCSINPGLHDHFVLMRILNSPEGPEITDEFFRANQEKINAALPQFAENPPRLSIRDEKMNDVDYWGPELGSNGWAGIVKQRHSNGRDEDSTYYIAVKAGVGPAINDLIEDFSNVEQPKDVTFEQLLRYDKDYAYLRDLGKRNVLRGAFRVAQALGVRIHHTMDYTAHSKGQVSKPFMALPLEGDHIQPLSSMEIVEQSPNVNVAINASMCVVPTKVKKQCIVMVDPYVGLVGFNMNPVYRGDKATPFSTLALPVCTGRAVDSSSVSTKNGRNMKKRLKGVMWENKNGDINDRLAPEAYNQFDEQFEKSLEKAGWNKRWGIRSYIPVVMKLANRKISRN